MRSCLVHGTKAAAMAAIATVAGWKLFDGLNAWVGHSADSQVASGGPEWFAGFTEYLVADVVGILFLPLAVWTGLRLARIKGNHLAVIVSGLTWFALAAPRLVDTRPGPGTVIWCVAAEAVATGAAAALQTLATATARR
ncbi:hypothetical protein ACFWMU_18060 [Streptomyces sp. NPDC058357]|uniref:hypothetical protein n=1 Tax=unclassified Streptomyces TaxID=2593676 RepID=UPI00365A1DBB